MNARSSNPDVAATTARTPDPLYGGSADRRVTVRDLAAAKARGEKWPMLTSYDALTARVFDEAGIPSCWSATPGMVVGHDTTPPGGGRPVPHRRGGPRHPARLVVADLPFGLPGVTLLRWPPPPGFPGRPGRTRSS
jgi:3-methyl-2-oxobutanoate hydroxymethyltransferase